MFRPILFLAIIRLDTIIGENYAIYNVIQYNRQCWCKYRGTRFRLHIWRACVFVCVWCGSVCVCVCGVCVCVQTCSNNGDLYEIIDVT